MQDLVVVAITSQLTDQHAVVVEQGDCVDGTLPKTSVVKLAKLFTIHSTLVLKSICTLRTEKLDTVLGELRRFFS
jgi:hypothetical protein